MSKRGPSLTAHRSFLIAALAAIAAGAVWLILAALRRPAQPVAPAATTSPVTTATARRGPIERTVPITGVIRWQTETQLAAPGTRFAGGPSRVLAVGVHEGDVVRRGQLLLRLDDREARAALDTAAAGVRAAEAALAKARSGATLRNSEVDTGLTTAEAGVTAAQARLTQARGAARSAEAEAAAEVRRAAAGLAAARANLAAATRGPRPAQRRQAEAAVTQAEAAASAARRGLAEAQFLYDRGGLTRAQLDEARTADQTARAQLESAQAALELALEGATPEERRAAEAAVEQAEAGVAAAQAGARRARLARHDATAAAAQLRQAEAGLRSARAGRAGRSVAREDVSAAAAALEQARVQWRQALDQVAATRLVSPVNGVVTLRAAEPGQIAQPGQPLIAVAAGSPALEAPVSAPAVTLLRPGQPLALTSLAAPGRRFRAVLQEVPSVPGPDGRTYVVRAPLLGGRLPPGVRARGVVQVARVPDAVLLPTAAVQRASEGPVVWVVKAGRAERHPVQLGIETDTAVQILSGITPGETVIVAGAEGLRPGDPVDAGRRSGAIADCGLRIADCPDGPVHSAIRNPQSAIAGAERRWA